MANNSKINASLPSFNGANICLCCYEKLGSNKFALRCGHTFCISCWEDHAKASVQSENFQANAKCMQQGCNLVLGHSLYLRFLTTSSLQDLYWKQLCKSYTDLNNQIKWCPQKGCEYCFEQSSYHFQSTVDCKCGMSFCMLCSSDSHLPCDCTLALKWKEKFSAESENVIWINANTKTCPKCHKPIEKNAGCNHMTCRQCNHQFCWVCMTDWSSHGTATGGAYKCNKYEEEVKKNVKLSEQEAKQANA